MYLSHHYLIDLAGGACLSVLTFYLFMPEEFKDSDQIQWDRTGSSSSRDEYELVNGNVVNGASLNGARHSIDLDEEIRKLEENGDADLEGVDELDPRSSLPRDEEGRIESLSFNAQEGGDPNRNVGSVPKLKKKRSVTWGETKVLGDDSSEGSANGVIPSEASSKGS